ncbi:MAG: hypothetical protein ABEH64_13215, partial [Salinirussus sp.]
MFAGRVDVGHESWTKSGRICWRGTALDRDGQPVDVADWYGCTETFEAFVERTRALSGFYAVVIRTEDAWLLACDHARTIPLYFRMETPVVITDAAGRIRPADGGIDPVAASEFLLTRYVTSGDTLDPRIKSVRAGEAVKVPRDRQMDVKRRRYFTHQPTNDHSGNRTTALKRLRTALNSAIDRAVDFIDGRQVVVPLSGGLDSRLVAAALVEAGVDVIAFTFGRPGHG